MSQDSNLSMEGDFSTSLCESEFQRMGLTFWTGDEREVPAPFDCHTAASVGDKEYMASLPLVVLDSVNCGGWTPLMYASYLGHKHLVEYLISRSCDALNENKEGRTPLMLAAMCGNVSIVEYLTAKCGKQALQQTDKRNFTALVHAVASGHQDVAETLLRGGSSPNVTEHKKGYSALMIAAEDGNLSLVEMLLHYGADYIYTNVIGDSARSVADRLGHDTIARCFLRLMMKNSGGQSTFPSSLEGPARVDLLLTQRKMEKRENMTLARFLNEIGLDKYHQVFVDQEIDFQVLLTLTDSELKQVGISLLGPRRKITGAIARWKNEYEDQKIIG